MPDGALAADAVWVNIVNIDASITAIDSGRVHLHHNGRKVVGHVVSGTTAAVYNHTPAIADLSGPAAPPNAPRSRRWSATGGCCPRTG